jgi:uncharacterized protein
MTVLTLAEVEALTLEYGGSWGLAHVKRLLALIVRIGAGLEHDAAALTWAVYLHDWGAYPKYSQAGVEHAARSRQIAEAEILPRTDLSAQARSIVLEAIDRHDYRDERPVSTNEALLLREADFLDFLGIIGVAREFAKGPKDLQKCYRLALARREDLKDRFTLPAARRIAEQRLASMDGFLSSLLEESFGHL